MARSISERAPQVPSINESDSRTCCGSLDRQRTATAYVRKRWMDVVREVKRRGVFYRLRSFLDARLTVSIPRHWEGSVLSVSTVSGALQVKEPVSGRSVYLKSVSGAINFDTIRTTREASVETVSGAIRGHLVEAGELDLSSVSGAIQVDSITETGNGKGLSDRLRFHRIGGRGTQSKSARSGQSSVSLPRFEGRNHQHNQRCRPVGLARATARVTNGTQRHTVGSVPLDGSGTTAVRSVSPLGILPVFPKLPDAAFISLTLSGEFCMHRIVTNENSWKTLPPCTRIRYDQISRYALACSLTLQHAIAPSKYPCSPCSMKMMCQQAEIAPPW